MKRIQSLGIFILATLFVNFISIDAFSQKFKKKKPETLWARNKKKNFNPIYVGIGTSAPTTQLHVVGSVRFENLANNNTVTRIVGMDNAGNLVWRDVNITIANAWLLAGNAATSAYFLGTTNAEDLRIRTNNIQRAVFSSGGSFGLGVTAPTAQLHTNGTVRFEGVGNNNTFQRMGVFDNNGNLFYRDVSSLQSNFWSLTGNSGTNPANNFLGTTDNNRLVFRTNNTEKMTILPDGKLGLGTINPQVLLQATSNPGTITAFPYEAAVFEKNGDAKLTILSSDNTGVGGAAIALGHSNFTVGGLYQGFEMQYGINNGRYLRFNYIPRNASGVIQQSDIANILLLSDNSRVGVNLGPTGGGSTPNFPSANFHTNGTVRFQNLPTSPTGSNLVVDANGNVSVSTAGSTNAWSLTGNFATNPAINFLGTTDNNRLVIRTNNAERMTILANGRIGINNSNPIQGSFVVNSSTEDNHIRIQGNAPSIVFEGSPGPNNEGRIGYATINNNYVTGSIPGDLIVQTIASTGNLIFGTGGGGTGNGFERGRFNSVGYFGVATQLPTAKLHINCSPVVGQTNPSNVRFESLPIGAGNALVMDANGYIFKSNTLVGREAAELKEEIKALKEEIESLRAIVNSIKAGTLSIQVNENKAQLFQNIPNPFSQLTTIRYYLPDNIQKANLHISDLQGKLLKIFSLAGKQSVQIEAGELSAGTFIYSLVIDDKIVDSKKMILTR
jgi:hypothetical protein